jgi:hypothetical protein
MNELNGDESGDLARLARRIEILEAEADIRRLVASHQWASDAGSPGLDIPDWATRPVRWPPNGTTSSPGGGSAWARGGVWEGSGLSEMFAGATTQPMGTGAAEFSNTRPHWMPHMMHFLSNEWIHVQSPTEAVGRWYSWEAATVAVDGELVAVWIAGRYHIRFIHDDGEWRFARMEFQEIFSTPFDSSGWTEVPHVSYGPRQITR